MPGIRHVSRTQQRLRHRGHRFPNHATSEHSRDRSPWKTASIETKGSDASAVLRGRVCCGDFIFPGGSLCERYNRATSHQVHGEHNTVS